MIKRIFNHIASYLHIKRRIYLSGEGKAAVSVSYAITVCNESEALRGLLECLIPCIEKGDEIIVQADSGMVTEEVKAVVAAYGKQITRYAEYPLNYDFAQAKNHLNSLCKGRYIFQLDADEQPDAWLLAHLKEIMAVNEGIELFKLPRVNNFTKEGVIVYHHQQWPDYQGRIYWNEPDRILWHKPLHERIQGHRSYIYLPKDDRYAIIHCKDIDQHNQKWAVLTPHLRKTH